MNKKKLKNLINFIFVNSGMSALASQVIHGQNMVRILLYHRVNDTPLVEASISDRLTVSVEKFRKQMEYVAGNFNVMSFSEFGERRKYSEAIPEKTVILTFDDGYLDNYNFAFPILKEFKIPATIFLATDYINTNRFLWWDVLEEIVLDPGIDLKELFVPELHEGINFAREDRVHLYWEIYNYLKSIDPSKREDILLQISPEKRDLTSRQMLSWKHIVEMSKQNISFGAHTQSHAILSKISLAQAKNEIRNSKSEIEYRIQKRVVSFAYPNGGPDTFNDDIVEILKQSGYENAVTTVKGFVNSKDDLFRLKRYNIDGEDSLSTFKCKLSGIYEMPGLFQK